MFFLYATLTAFSVGFLVTPILISFLKKFKIGDHPGGRKIHKAFIPSMGGISFVVSTTVSLAIWAWQFPLPDLRYILGAILLMFIVGLRDDLVELKASRKLMGQLVAVLLVVVVADVRITDFHGFLGLGELHVAVSYIFSGIVLLALTNGFNLIDGLDGLAGTIAVITFGCLGTWFLFQGINSYALISFIFLGGVLAFLAFNWHPAKLFMGDTGSLTLGFTLGTLIIGFIGINEALPEEAFLKIESTFAASVALMMFPLYDMGRVFTRRVSQGKKPMSPDKSHVHHFLMRMGLKHNHVALILGTLQLGIILLVFLMRDLSDNIVLPVIVAISIFLGYRLDKITVHYLRKKVALQPKVLEIRPVKLHQKSKIKLDKSEFNESSRVNMN